ncbi:hypothetical protein BGX33_007701 [Mortierella sp. NVP41]|nr:hypothetical protein BGX33_007701 [Mortierella sp. NVP41]
MDITRPIQDSRAFARADPGPNPSILPDLGKDKRLLILPTVFLGRSMGTFCPSLKSTDLSHHNELRPDDWSQLLNGCAHRLESFVTWNVQALGPGDLVRLISPNHLSIKNPVISTSPS